MCASRRGWAARWAALVLRDEISHHYVPLHSDGVVVPTGLGNVGGSFGSPQLFRDLITEGDLADGLADGLQCRRKCDDSDREVIMPVDDALQAAAGGRLTKVRLTNGSDRRDRLRDRLAIAGFEASSVENGLDRTCDEALIGKAIPRHLIGDPHIK